MRWIIAALLVSVIACSCTTLSYGHMSGGRPSEWEHPWHSVPCKVVAYPVAILATIVSFPAMCVEAVFIGKLPSYDDTPGVTLLPAKYATMGISYAVAFPFYAVGLPFELTRREPREPHDVEVTAPSSETASH
jgi:hypothetical protein